MSRRGTEKQRRQPESYQDFDDSDSEEGHVAKKAKRLQANKEWRARVKQIRVGGEESEDASEESWDPNPRHSAYYRIQLPQLKEYGDWEAFQRCLSRPLPLSFRLSHLTISRPSVGTEDSKQPTAIGFGFMNRLQRILGSCRGHFLAAEGVKDGIAVNQQFLTSLAWTGSLQAMMAAVDSTTLAQSEPLSALREFLDTESRLGHIVRQEVVSMIPVLALAVKPTDIVVDLCSAPGSKTEQVLALMQANCAGNELPTGFVIANDPDPKRIARLSDRYSRCGHPSLVLTCCTAEKLLPKLGKRSIDRIICDVPCSGDATFRKCPHLWRLFRPRMAMELHPLQLQIATAGVQLLKAGGRFVYSTCSLNPIEDESVVAELLRLYKGDIRLVDVRKEEVLGEFKTCEGLSSWHCSAETFVAGEVDEIERKSSLAKLPPIAASMQPPTAEEAAWMNLRHCMRVMPQQQDTGGFFIAVFEPVYTDKSAAAKSGAFKAKVGPEQAVNVLAKLGYNPKREGESTQPKLAALPETMAKDLTAAFGKPTERMRIATADGSIHLLTDRFLHFLSKRAALEGVLVQAGCSVGHFDNRQSLLVPNPDHFYFLQSHRPVHTRVAVQLSDFIAMARFKAVVVSKSANRRVTAVPITAADVSQQEMADYSHAERDKSKETPVASVAEAVRNKHLIEGVFDLSAQSITDILGEHPLSEAVQRQLSTAIAAIVGQSLSGLVGYSSVTIELGDLSPVGSPSSAETAQGNSSSNGHKVRLSKAQKKKLKKGDGEQEERSSVCPESSLEASPSSAAVTPSAYGAALVYLLSTRRIAEDVVEWGLTRLSHDDKCLSLASNISCLAL